MTATPRPDAAGLPETVPARMVNEFVYCPRLFHLEWVQGRFASSADVEEGLHVHRIVDRPSGDIPAAGEDMEPLEGRAVRSLWLSSTEWGVSAKIDIAEVRGGGTVVPVDYKKGRPGRGGRPWPSDRIQSGLQALLLREAGYEVPHAEVWYAATRQRVEIAVDEGLVDLVRAVLADLWQVAARETAPPPLADSPKCPGCSLAGLCLPEEIGALAAGEGSARPRRLMAADPDSQPVYVQEQGSVVGVSGGRLTVTKDDTTLSSLRLIDVQQVCLLGNVSVTPQAMRELFAREIPVCWFTLGGWFSGMAQGLPGKHVDLRRRQYTATDGTRLAVSRSMVEGKIRNCRTLLRRNSRADVAATVDQLRDLAASAAQATCAPSLLGIEGAAARLYFRRFTEMVTADTGVDVASFSQNGRARRPPPDPVNALLSFVYALLVKDVTATLVSIGFDPYAGLYHQPRYGRPALALDLAEEFRPLVADSTVIQLLNNGEVRPAHFAGRAGGCQLERDGRRAVIQAYQRRMEHQIKHPVFGYRVTYRRAIEVQARLLGAVLTDEIPRYVPFTTR